MLIWNWAAMFFIHGGRHFHLSCTWHACLETFSKCVHHSLFQLNCSATELEIHDKALVVVSVVVLVVVQGNIYLAIYLRPLISFRGYHGRGCSHVINLAVLECINRFGR